MTNLEVGFSIGIFFVFFIGGVVGFCLKKFINIQNEKKIQQKIEQANKEAQQIIQSARADIKIEIKQIRKEASLDIEQRRQQNINYESLLMKREKNIVEREEVLQSRYRELIKKQDYLKEIEQKYEKKIEQIIIELEKNAGLSQEEAKYILFQKLETKLDLELGQLIKNKENEAKLQAKDLANNIITFAIEKNAGDFVVEKTTSFIKLPSDEMKGRIIGKEGRNIKTFELITGVDVIIDDSPEVIQISCFNPIRREIAVRTLNSLLKDGRIQPTRIEEVFKKTQKEIDILIQEAGQQAVRSLRITDMSVELINYIGKLKYRTSFGQNALQHCVEVANLAGSMASELGLDEKIAKRAGLLHDIGKAIDYEMEGSHVHLGAQLAKKFNENNIIINAIQAHHGEVSCQSPYAVLVIAADKISAARPGARNNSLEDFIQRMQQIEDICQSIDGVKKSYAVQAGRQIRIIVDAEKVSDAKTYKIARDVRKRVEKEITIPGDIFITVIRELRVNEIVR